MEKYGKFNDGYFPIYIYPKTKLFVHKFNRLISDYNGLSENQILSQLEGKFRISQINTSDLDNENSKYP